MKYELDDFAYTSVEFLGSFKAKLYDCYDNHPCPVAQLGDHWWYCDNNWTTKPGYNFVRNSVNKQLNKLSERYLADLIVGVALAEERTPSHHEEHPALPGDE